MSGIFLETLTALFKSIVEGLARYGCGLAGIGYEELVKDEDKPTGGK